MCGRLWDKAKWALTLFFLKVTASALSPGGVFAVWGENPDAAFEKRLTAAGFSFDRQRPGRGGLRHVVYVAQVKPLGSK